MNKKYSYFTNNMRLSTHKKKKHEAINNINVGCNL